MDFNTVGIIGLGLIGGSLAKTIKRIFPETNILATSGHVETLQEAARDGIIENTALLQPEDFAACDVIFLCCPVKTNLSYLSKIKDYIKTSCILTDVGSVKSDIHKGVEELHLEGSFIGGHPMAGSEKTGYDSATSYLFENAYYILTKTNAVDSSVFQSFKEYIDKLGACTLCLTPEEHDYATASISHLPHVIAASLVHLVKNIDTKDHVMKTIAAGGFKDITRIASSSPVMWQDICLSNKDEILHLIDLYKEVLDSARETVASASKDSLYSFFEDAKNYRDSLPIKHKGPLPSIFEIYCDLIDETGGIATLATILATNQISIKNIGILHNREFEQGVLHIEFYDQNALDLATVLLEKHHYKVYQR